MKTKPLWRRFAEMTPDEAKAEQAAEIERLEQDEMSDAELEERVAAWDRAAAWQAEQAQLLEQLERLAHATGCPKDKPPVTWLIEHDLLIETDGGYAFTAKAKGLHAVDSHTEQA